MHPTQTPFKDGPGIADPMAHAGGYPPGDGGPGWGPPGGGAPPPGGGGSYGAPPPPMGPPGGGSGGYGPPPPPGGGGYGPPGGFGPVGPSFGGPPPPAPSGSKLPLILGIGCGGLLLLCLIGGIGAAFFVSRSARSYAPPSSYESPPPVIATVPTGVGTPAGGTPELELKDLRSFKGSFGKQRHFVGEIHNTGTVPAGYPSVKVTIVDASNTAIDGGSCSSLTRVLEPGDKVPCTFSLFKAETSTNYKTEIKPMKAFFRGELADLEVTETKVVPKRGYKPAQVTGKITNNSSFKAKMVMALASLYGKDGKIVGADQALVAGNDLEPGASALFDAKIYNLAEPADTFRVKAIGYSE